MWVTSMNLWLPLSHRRTIYRLEVLAPKILEARVQFEPILGCVSWLCARFTPQFNMNRKQDGHP